MYATINQVKDYILREITPAFEPALEGFIKMAGDYIDKFCNRSFEPAGSTPATKYYDGSGSDTLEIDDLQSLSAVTVFDIGFDATSIALYPSNETPKTRLKMKSTYGPLGTSRRPVYLFDKGEQNVAVTGVWGYGSEVPPGITLACLKLVGAIIKENSGEGDANEITRESLGDYSVDYQKVSEIAHSLKVDALLAPFKREKAGTHRTGSILL